MLILTIRTDKPEAEISLFNEEGELTGKIWAAHRQLAESLHNQIKKLLESINKDWPDVQGIVCYEGPGSFTGLRIGLSVANSLAYGLNIPIIGSTGNNWRQSGIELLLKGDNQNVVRPQYGAEAHITAPKK